jgi:anti-anti-sigma regulatory factor
MIKLSESGGMLHAIVVGECDYATSRELLLACKSKLHNVSLTNIKVTLQGVSVFHTCAIGALLLLSESVDGRLHVNLKDCSAEIHQMFESDALKRRFNTPLKISSPSLLSACSRCFHENCQHPGPGCMNPSMAE